jgi:hypothetical protein
MQMQIFRRAVLGLMVLGMTLSMLAILSCGGSDDTATDNTAPPATGVVKRQASLSGTTEVPVVPSSPGTGTAVLTISSDRQQISYVLTYAGLTNVLQAHIHAGSPTERGGIILFLCANGTLKAGAPATAPPQDCPPSAGTVTGTLTAKDLVPVPAQGTTAAVNTFDDAVNQLLNGNTYTNVHTGANPGGEIRGQDLPPT